MSAPSKWYCSFCGNSLSSSPIRASAQVCSHCGRHNYPLTKVAVEAALRSGDNRILVCRRRFEPRAGKLDLPGGFLDIDETAEFALLREISEEVGLDSQAVANLHYISSATHRYEFEGIAHPVLVLQFIGTFTGQPRAGDEVAEVLLLPRAELAPHSLAWPELQIPLIDAAFKDR